MLSRDEQKIGDGLVFLVVNVGYTPRSGLVVILIELIACDEFDYDNGMV